MWESHPQSQTGHFTHNKTVCRMCQKKTALIFKGKEQKWGWISRHIKTFWAQPEAKTQNVRIRARLSSIIAEREQDINDRNTILA